MGLPRPGNTAADHTNVFESALAQLPDLPHETRLLVRADSGGSAKAFLAYVREAHVMFSVVRFNQQIKAVIRTLHRHTSVWTPAITLAGASREGALRGGGHRHGRP